ncbi:hypothetical protein [Francisella sp. SYW-9]|uniref:hypothetical protein n=1 Tax=Francisella sp. SYW-9 TaxID=2610888 RepID=UPI00123D9AA0|nr:hypothetical protein [Francisella sp. SYW-9]
MKKLFLSILIITLSLGISFSAEKDYFGMSKEQAKHTILSKDIYNAKLTYPYPAWFSTGLVGDVYRSQKGLSSLYEQIPIGQKFDSWNEIYTIAGIYDKDNKISLSQYQSFVLGGFSKSCNHNIKIVNAVKTKSSSMAILLCGSLSDKNLKVYKNQPGEVAIFKFIKFENTLIQVGQEWKTKPFDANKINNSDFLNKAYKYTGSRQNFRLAFQKMHKNVSVTQATTKPD